MCHTTPNNLWLIEQFKDSSVYGHSVDGQIVVHETHISWVILAGHFAYKVKKAIETDFLDYTSLSKRHHACCEEMRLNSRYADGMYLDVVPIAMEDGCVKMDGDALPIEFAVRMRRFPEDSLLANRIDANRVNDSDMFQLAKSIASFHRRADVWRGSSDQAVAGILNQAKANFTNLYCPPLSEHENTLRQLEDWTDQFFARHKTLFERRVCEGFVRECHGDLHCENIVFWHEHFVPFDGIEFNSDYSWIDVLSDVAFLTMDLQARDRTDLAACFLNAYLEQTGDYESLQLLIWYKVYRALVRAKVAMLRYQQTSLDAGQPLELIATAKKFLLLAHQWIEAGPHHLWITHGVSGSGKTTGSLEHVKAKGAIRIRSDIERKRLIGTSPTLHSSMGLDEGIYAATTTRATYQALLGLARKILRSGFSVVVDATFLRFSDRKLFCDLARAEGVPFHILDFQAETTVLRRRIADRALARVDASDANLLVLERQLTEQDPLNDCELKQTVSVVPDSSRLN